MSKAKRTEDVTASVDGKPVEVASVDQSSGIVRLSETPPKKSTVTISGVLNDDDASDIAPALSEQEWHTWRTHRLNPVTMLCEVGMFAPNANNLAKTIAIAFDQMHDEDVRKIARPETVARLREIAEWIGEQPAPPIRDLTKPVDDSQYRAIVADSERLNLLHELADAIESYLSPS